MSEDPYAIKRGGPRISLVAAAQITVRAAGTPLNVRLSELSARGCYIDTLNPFDVGTEVLVHISHNNTDCDVNGKIIYSHAGYGMGVVFLDVPLEQREMLDAWMAEGAASS